MSNIISNKPVQTGSLSGARGWQVWPSDLCMILTKAKSARGQMLQDATLINKNFQYVLYMTSLPCVLQVTTTSQAKKQSICVNITLLICDFTSERGFLINS